MSNITFLFTRFLSLVCLPLFLTSCSTTTPRVYNRAPSELDWASRQMKTAGFWISRHPFPDKLILSREGIKALNYRIQDDLKLVRDIFKIGEAYSGKELACDLTRVLDNIYRRRLYKADGSRINSVFCRDVKGKMNLGAIPPGIKPRYGAVVHYANLRLLPTQDTLYTVCGDVDFDELQNSALGAGTLITVLHESLDGKWAYVLTDFSSGWVKIDNIVLCDLSQLAPLVNSQSFLVVTSPKADIYLNPSLTEYYDYVRMGTRLAVNKEIEHGVIEAFIASCDSNGAFIKKPCYLRKEDVSLGYLPYTARTIIQQAFKLLNAPYGWGGMYGEQDCSQFIQEIFSTAGIFLPRDSGPQSQVGSLFARFSSDTPEQERLKVISQGALGGITVLYLKGHIMLFLGMVEDRAYAIDAIWAYRKRRLFHDDPMVINRVAVTELSLGKGSRKGSLLERLISARIVDNE